LSKINKKGKIRRNRKAVSPVLAVLMMVAVAIAASLVAYAWIMNYLAFTTAKTGRAIQIQSFAEKSDGTELWVYVQNVGQGVVEFDPEDCCYVNNGLESASIEPVFNTLDEGNTATLTIALSPPLDVTETAKIRIVTIDGTFTEVSSVPYISEAVNHAPVLSTIGDKSTDEETLLIFDVDATDPDVGQTLAFSLEGTVPPGASINSGTGVFTWTPTEAQGPGDYSITVRVTDNGSPALYDEEIITITINEVNRAPVIDSYLPVAEPTVLEGGSQDLSITCHDPDGTTPTESWLLDDVAVGTGLSYTYSPNYNSAGPHIVKVVVSDGSLTAEHQWTVTVTDVPQNLPHYVDTNNAVHDTNVGSHSSFPDMKNDGSYDALTEGNVAVTGESWISPTSYTSSDWSNEANAYDNNLGTRTSYDVSDDHWSPWLILNYPSTTGTKIRYYAEREDTNIDNLQIDVYTTSWQNVYSGAPTVGAWTNVTFSSRTTTAIRFRFYNNHNWQNRYAYVYEVDVLSVSPPNYQLDLEVQFTGVTDYTYYTQLEIKTGTLATENLAVYYWSGSAWIQLPSALSANTVNTYSVSLTGTGFELRFYDQTRTSDTTQSSWQIDYVRLVAP